MMVKSPGVSANTAHKLKQVDQTQLPPSDPGCRSDILHGSPVPSNVDPRDFYLEHGEFVPPPLISCSGFVPRKLVDLLMRKKKDSALGVKFVRKRISNTSDQGTLDEITDMEGALHTFVTPVVSRCEMIGDYRYDSGGGGHGVCAFGDEERDDRKGGIEKFRLMRSVVLSASIQMDFENSKVMLKVCKLDSQQVVGRDLGEDDRWDILSTERKQNDGKRIEYDESLRRHMVFHLTKNGGLPSRAEVGEAMDAKRTITYLESVILGQGDVGERMVGRYAETYNDQVISLELLFNTAVHQARNEISALEVLCQQGYVYTYDPASIFAREIGPQILNRLTLAAVRFLSDHNQFENMRIFSFNDYADRGIVNLALKALEKQPHLRVVRKADLFTGIGGSYDVTKFKEAEAAMLVVHNNSDGFGQNIETEGVFGSLDGAIGSNSSAAGSLKRDRKDLVEFVC